MSEEEIVEKVARAIWNSANSGIWSHGERDMMLDVARAAYALLRPLVLEEAAKKLDWLHYEIDAHPDSIAATYFKRGADAIRALSTSPPRTVIE